jgi:hypothetical protein
MLILKHPSQKLKTNEVKIHQISIHALNGTPTQSHTFTLRVQLGKKMATALVDSGSDISFISSSFAVKNSFSISNVEGIKVAAANGTTMISNTTCINTTYSIQGHTFQSDLRLVDFKGYDLVFGADWLYTHSPVGLDLKRREFSITKEATHLVTFVDETLNANKLTISPRKLCHSLKKRAVGVVVILNHCGPQESVQQNDIPLEVSQLLSEYSDVFQDPDHLPPERTVDHSIPLLQEDKPVNQRPYRLPYHKKNAMENLIKQLLDSHMIQPSVSPYSSPVILVKKKDGTWRLCVDYRQLNSNISRTNTPSLS